MSQVLYETELYFTYKGKKLHVTFNEEYYDAVPRSLTEERQLVKESMLEDGLLEELKLNTDGEVLDGHTRIEIGEEIGWKRLDGKPIIPRFKVKEFETKDQERQYVIKINLMRRHLNAFQKVRLAAKLYVHYNNGQHMIREGNRYSVLVELKKQNEPVRASLLAESLYMRRSNILKLLSGLKEDFCVRCEEEKNPKDTGMAYLFSILPKGEEVLSKGKPDTITMASIGRSVGVGRVRAGQAIYLLNNANNKLLEQLEKGQIAISTAYTGLVGKETKIPYISGWKPYTKVICPICEKVSQKKDWRKFDDGE